MSSSLARNAAGSGVAFSAASLHAKWFAIDRSALFIGSFNWDPRSVDINTEMGVLIESPQLATHMVETTLAAFPDNSYRLSLDERGRMQWSAQVDGETTTTTREPDASLWARFVAGLLRLLPIRSQL